MRQVLARLNSLELFVQSLPPELQAGRPVPGISSTGSSSSGTAVEATGEPILLDQDHDDHEDTPYLSDTEEATLALEQLARGTLAPSLLPSSAPPLSAAAPNTAELTSALTSIIALPISDDTDFSTCLDFGIPQADVLKERMRAIERVYPILPNRPTAAVLVNRYFEEFDWVHPVVYKPSFLAEFDYYWGMVEAGRQKEVCPIWLAQYCMILSLALDGFNLSTTQLVHSPPSFDSSLAFKLYQAAQRLLHLGDWHGTPQARSITTAILITQAGQFSAVGGQLTKFMGWLGGAIRIAQVLGLHKLGDDPEVMPVDDPSWPAGKNSVKRQSGLRIFAALLFMDWLCVGGRFPAYALHEGQFTTGHLMNINESDLSPTNWRVNPLPHSIVTDVSFEVVKRLMAAQTRRGFDFLAANNGALNYEAVLTLDAEYRVILGALPEQFKTENTLLEAEYPKVRWMRHASYAGLHARLMRLHRPFMNKQPVSAEQASAKMVIASHHQLMTQSTGAYFLYIHSISASLVLFLDLFRAIDQGCSDTELQDKKDLLNKAFEVFSHNEIISSHRLRGVVQLGATILSGLFRVAAEKMSALQAHQRSPATIPKPARESFAQVLSRISQELSTDSSTAGKRATTSTSPPAVEVLLQSQAAVDRSFDQFSADFFREFGMPLVQDTGEQTTDLSFLESDFGWTLPNHSQMTLGFDLGSTGNGLPTAAEQTPFVW
ncbi:C6 transcription factor [Pseudohyphozyma bogoriensis]|nr:C6 transcription factor [Pseudohyphozyma bogoriensis]